MTLNRSTGWTDEFVLPCRITRNPLSGGLLICLEFGGTLQRKPCRLQAGRMTLVCRSWADSIREVTSSPDTINRMNQYVIMAT